MLLLLDWTTVQRQIDYAFHAAGAAVTIGSTVNLTVWLVHELIWWAVATLLAALILALLMQA